VCQRLLRVLRSAAAVTTGVKLTVPLLGMFGVEMTGDDGLLRTLTDLMLSTPVFAIAAMIVGQWIGEMVDGYHYRIEGGFGGASRHHLVRRLQFTTLIMKRPFWYPTEDRIKREFDRTNRALIAAGIQPIDPIPADAGENVRAIQEDYILACMALLKGVGVRKTATLSAAVKRRTAHSPSRTQALSQ